MEEGGGTRSLRMQLAIRALISLKPGRSHNHNRSRSRSHRIPRGDDDDFRQGRQLRVDTLRNYIEQT